jgi:hypothetical protein
MYEQDSIGYINQLIADGVIITGNLVSVFEEHLVSKAIATFLVNGVAQEKYIIITKPNDIFTWHFLYPVDFNQIIQKQPGDWSYPDYLKRIVAPISLIMDDYGIKMYGWFSINNLPTVTVENTVYLYCNTILPEHQAIVDSYQGIITVENKF